MEPDTSNISINLSKYSDIDTSKEEEKISNATNPAINDIMNLKHQHKASYSVIRDVANLFNGRNPEISLPTNKKQLKKSTEMRFEREFVLICKCDNIYDENGFCSRCKVQNKKKKSNFMVIIPIEQQIKYLLDKYFDIIIEYKERARSDGSGQKLYSGTKACTFCLHPGVSVKDHLGGSYVRYIKINPEPDPRTHMGVVKAIERFD